MSSLFSTCDRRGDVLPFHLPYDTLDTATDGTDGDDDIADLATPEDLANLLFGAVLNQTDVVGWALTGKMDRSLASEQGERAWGTRCARLMQHPLCEERWQVCSAPRNRMGRPIAKGEVRRIATRIFREGERTCTVTRICLWIRHDGKAHVRAMHEYQRSFSARGAPMVPVALFNMPLPDGLDTDTQSYMCHTRTKRASLIPSMALHVATFESPGKGKERCFQNVESHQGFLYQLKVALANVSDRLASSASRGASYEVDFETQPSDITKSANRFVSQMVTERAMDEKKASKMAVVFGETAFQIADGVSGSGLLDLLADNEFGSGTLPDSLLHVSRLPMIIVMAVRLAIFPDSFGLSRGSDSDVFAANELAEILDSVKSTLPRQKFCGAPCDEDKPPFEPAYAVDVILARAIFDLSRLYPAGSDFYVNVISNMRALLSIGYEICQDVCGPDPRDAVRGDEICAPENMGVAYSCMDPLRQEVNRNAWANDINAASTAAIRRTSPKDRLNKLVSLFVCLESWLRNSEAERQRLVKQTKLSSADHTNAARAAAALISTGQEASRKRSAKKQSKAKEAREARLNEMEQTIRDLGAKVAGLDDSDLVDAELDSLAHGLKIDSDLTPQRRIEEHKLRMEWSRATQLHFDLSLQMPRINWSITLFRYLFKARNIFVALSSLHDCAFYAVGDAIKIECCSAGCSNSVGVLESVGLGGEDGACPDCNAPRCMTCVCANMQTRIYRKVPVHHEHERQAELQGWEPFLRCKACDTKGGMSHEERMRILERLRLLCAAPE